MAEAEASSALSCPICLGTPNDKTEDGVALLFCKSECHHEFCVPCIEHFLSKSPEAEDSDGFLYASGTCPICRGNINLFELKLINSDDFAFPKNRQLRTWPIYNQRYVQQPYSRGASFADLKRMGPMDGYGFCFQFSYHDIAVPHVMFPAFLHSGGEVKIQSIILNFTDYHFFHKRMTFHGSVDLHPPVSLRKKGYKYSGMTCVLQFSRNGQFVRDGHICWRVAHSDAPGFYPLDGEWVFMHPHGPRERIFVQNHRFCCEGEWIEIEIDPETHCPKFKLPSDLVPEELVDTSFFALPPGSSGPKEGELLKWTSTHSPTIEIQWKRVSVHLANALAGVPLKPMNDFIYRQVNRRPSARSLPSYHASELWGNTFCQDFCIGLASYHFVTSENAYISYEHPRTAFWPTLDDGSPVPSRVNFQNPTWEETTRTFRGDVCWLEKYGTTWQGEAKWSYEIIFDEEFMYISGGTCRRNEGEHPPSHAFGQDLVYVNAKVEDPLRDYLNDGEIDCDVVFAGASGPTKGVFKKLIKNIVSGRRSAFDFDVPK